MNHNSRNSCEVVLASLGIKAEPHLPPLPPETRLLCVTEVISDWGQRVSKRERRQKQRQKEVTWSQEGYRRPGTAGNDFSIFPLPVMNKLHQSLRNTRSEWIPYVNLTESASAEMGVMKQRQVDEPEK